MKFMQKIKENPQTKLVKTIGSATSKAQKDGAVFKYKLEESITTFCNFNCSI